MNYRILGKTNFKISELSLGTWQVGGKWGDDFNHKNAEQILNDAIDNGINFIDTADVYSNGESEIAIGKILKNRSEKIYVATKCGRKLSPHINESYTTTALKKCVEDSLKRLQLDCIDLIQLHCPPTEVFYRDDIFELFDTLKAEGKIKNLGVSIEKVDEGLKAMTYENVTSIQFIFNMFRQKPIEQLLTTAQQKNVGLIARVPLASGLLTGKFSQNSVFSKNDHRFFNRNGEEFDKGETFSGIDYLTGLKAVDELKEIFPEQNLALVALKWILKFQEISCVIPGASSPQQLIDNLKYQSTPNISTHNLQQIEEIYQQHIKPLVHHLW